MASPMISFRASAEQTEAIRGNAQQCGLSVSEFLRRMVAPIPELPERASQCEQAGVPIHTRAAFGDGEAFSILADLHYRRAVEEAEPGVIALARSADYARLAAISQNTRESWIAFIYVLEQQSLALRQEDLNKLADDAQAEAVAVAEQMGEQGDEEIGQLVVIAGESVSPKVLALARDQSAIGAIGAIGARERNHRHAGFPGLRARLGGATDARLRNPLTGTPAAPVGFKLDAP